MPDIPVVLVLCVATIVCFPLVAHAAGAAAADDPAQRERSRLQVPDTSASSCAVRSCMDGRLKDGNDGWDNCPVFHVSSLPVFRFSYSAATSSMPAVAN